MRPPLADRLRDVVGAAGRAAPPSTRPTEIDEPSTARGRAERLDRIADALGGEWQETGGQRYLVVDRAYAPGHRHGRVAIMDGMPPAEGVWPGLRVLRGAGEAHGCEERQQELLLFVDLETTGVAGGAGTYAFLVGCGWFQGATFRIRQFFLPTYGVEPALLEGVTQLAEQATGLVTFNGKSFDMPLLETRFLFCRMETPFVGLPHVDMLHAARRLWRGDEDAADAALSSCRLSVLERSLCGLVREGDPDGCEIPSRYFSYVRTGEPRLLESVFEHNRLDLLSLALVTARAAQLVESGPHAARTGREALGLGGIYERAGLVDEACACYQRVTRLTGNDVTRAEALRAYAVICRRARRYSDAAVAWQGILDLRRSPARLAREATEALAIHHEHRLRDPETARRFALESLGFPATDLRRHCVHHRLARLDRKLAHAVAAPRPMPLPGI